MMFDGSKRAVASITEPKSDYTLHSASALVNGQLFIFGGIHSELNGSRKIARLADCEISELAAKLNHGRPWGHAALTIDSGKKALICFGLNSRTSCEVFDGTTSTATFSTSANHHYGGLAFYNGSPATVGSNEPDIESAAAESLSASDWTDLPDFPMTTNRHCLVGLQNGNLLLIGGRISSSSSSSQIWQLAGTWTQLGDLNQPVSRATAIKLGGNIVVVPGETGTKEVQRIVLTANEEIAAVTTVGETHSEYYYYPILLASSSNLCL